uniref:Uncharacterized protein n=1 Tax=Fibrocapsa japonica TaxID=94617 RepID=A0A6U1LIW4_9STRA|mmetsp:Transcript_10767/g.15970  ORF Transcript_10767/g.15970 Transcript_10767/m.15970 type:complete len:102 (+) Transcript_10767:152-457(+)|eukprot:CAMPEP_0113935738 /NCGR_PEP_ID=MMETSP1339-20121228/2833_1 /TAXON_ID=94617 /ORGANISM="Fibrocapsa japonica" /LENGTH=101 /DNA_ID=CAMNT_0000937991 /DNA_START=148 /DNA_END=453 /DNA_ORIENTATION=+ /assembly_acc=CAM_ASM_000762
MALACRSVASLSKVLTVGAIRQVATPLQGQVRKFSDTFKDREAAEENIWVRHEEEKMLKTLMAKFKKQEKEGKESLKKILGDKYEALGDDTIGKLIDWKHH